MSLGPETVLDQARRIGPVTFFLGPATVLDRVRARSGSDQARPGPDLEAAEIWSRESRGQPRTAVESEKDNFNTSQLGLEGPLPFQTSSWKVLKNGNVHF